MAKFCSKCGMKLNEQTGKCPNCDEKTKMDTASSDGNISINGNPKDDQNIKKTGGEQEVKKESKKKTKKIVVITIVIVVLLIGIGAGIGVVMVHNEKNANVPNNGEIQNTQSATSTETTSANEEVGLGSNYEVPEFDAEAYFRENTTLKSTFDVASSQYIHTESEAYDRFVERGFDGSQVMYEYTMDGTYLGANEISRSSSSKHPMYQAYYATTSGDIWMISEINGSFFATPITYNFSNEQNVPVILSETDTITSYDSSTNKFYVNIPNESQTVIKTVSKIDAETIEKLTNEEFNQS
ncbi:MAG: zinc ribbon domain-containing protein [Acutalibacteraceae bacterium]